MVLRRLSNASAYGGKVTQVLDRIREPLAELAEAFTDQFYVLLTDAPLTAEILRMLSPAEFVHLKQRQVEHLKILLSPELNGEMHGIEAERAGKAHAVVGVDVLLLIETFSLYLQSVQTLVRPLVPDPEEWEQLLRVLNQRILLDLEGQVAAYRRVEQEMAAATAKIDELVLSAGNRADLIRNAMSVIGGLEGNVSLLFARPDASGELLIEAYHGAAAENYHLAMEAGQVPRIHTDAGKPSGRGSGGRAWRSGQIEVTDSWAIDQRHAPWLAVGRKLGFRSSAAMPLLDAAGNSIALFSLYSAWPGFFSTLRVRGFLQHVQRVLNYGLERMNKTAVVPLREQQGYRRLLEEKQLVMVYQPIIDLRSGKLCRLEALARLQGDDGALIAPDRFLPAFGEAELLKLFEQGLARICEDAGVLYAAGLTVGFAINLPASGLGDKRYEECLFAVLDHYCPGPQRLQIEVLETEESSGQSEQAQAFMRRMREAGIRIAQDDLGSGHSSLLRLDQYGFDQVKIDQGLVRGALGKPQRALEFILYLTRLAHAFNTPVTVEGLENFGMIEAAMILGADHGQGFGIAKPMRIADVAGWTKSFELRVDPLYPQTALGALAAYLLWDMQLAVMADRPGLATDSPGVQGMMERFITARGLQGSPLDVALQDRSQVGIPALSEREQQVLERAHVIEQLTACWIEELGR